MGYIKIGVVMCKIVCIFTSEWYLHKYYIILECLCWLTLTSIRMYVVHILHIEIFIYKLVSLENFKILISFLNYLRSFLFITIVCTIVA